MESLQKLDVISCSIIVSFRIVLIFSISFHLVGHSVSLAVQVLLNPCSFYHFNLSETINTQMYNHEFHFKSSFKLKTVSLLGKKSFASFSLIALLRNIFHVLECKSSLLELSDRVLEALRSSVKLRPLSTVLWIQGFFRHGYCWTKYFSFLNLKDRNHVLTSKKG